MNFVKSLNGNKAVFGAMITGALIGSYLPEIGHRLSVFGDLYLSLVKMCVLPFVIATIVISFANLFKTADAAKNFRDSFSVFLLGMGVAGTLGVVTSLIASPYLLANDSLISTLQDSMAKISQPTMPDTESSILKDLIPVNIFRSLSEGKQLSILIFFILLGIAMGKEKKSSASAFLDTLSDLRAGTSRMINWFLMVLPLGILGLFAGTFSNLGTSMIEVLKRMALPLLIAIFLLIVIHLWIISIRTKMSPIRVLYLLRKPLSIGFGTTSSLTALPTLMETLAESFKLDKNKIGFISPISVTMNGQGGALFDCFLITFVCQLYSIPLSLQQLAFIVMGCVLHTWSSAGLPATVNLVGMVAIFRPLGIPTEPMLAILLLVLPLSDPLITMCNVLSNAAATTAIAKK